ncbi:hypothetical protein AMTRI_Chr01g136650 [Amborella trichopoda]
MSPAFLNRKRQDQPVLSWIISSLAEGIHAQISDSITLKDLHGILQRQEIRLSDQHGMLYIGSSSANLATTQNNSRVCNPVGHSALQCRHRFNHSFQPDLDVNLNAFHAAHSTIDDAWYPDSGMSNHITIKIGNGTSLCIKNIGSSKLTTNNATFFSLEYSACSFHFLQFIVSKSGYKG